MHVCVCLYKRERDRALQSMQCVCVMHFTLIPLAKYTSNAIPVREYVLYTYIYRDTGRWCGHKKFIYTCTAYNFHVTKTQHIPYTATLHYILPLSFIYKYTKSPSPLYCYVYMSHRIWVNVKVDWENIEKKTNSKKKKRVNQFSFLCVCVSILQFIYIFHFCIPLPYTIERR